ncbi:MAG: GNAT family N-acetyltransferase [Lachnospiraceae bacterium]|nr:GNAT family N-acetyltransferase [Lachnospiraceae bacterium]
MRDYEITELPKEEWKGTRIYLDYTTEEYYDVELTEDDNGFKAEMRKKRFETPFVHKEHGDFPDVLFPDYWEGAQVFGIVSEENGKKEILACVEICPEEWSNRMMVTEMWVSKKLRRQGIATALMNIAKEKAKEQGRRAVILETQSCNVGAIAFYRSQGFRLIGFDTCCYTNKDIEKREVRFNMGYFPEEHEERGGEK